MDVVYQPLSHLLHEVQAVTTRFLISEVVALASQVGFRHCRLHSYFHSGKQFNLIMLVPILAQATALLAVLPSAGSWTLPRASTISASSTLEVPWKERGLYSGSVAKSAAKRDGATYPKGCNHGPAARSCWKGQYNVDTDMDLEWPTTGVVRKVGR